MREVNMLGTVTPDEVRAFVHGMWANVAASWDAHADEIDERATPVTEQMLEMAELEASQRVLELASGPGGAGLLAAERVGARGEVLISDIVPAMVDSARRRAAARGYTNVTTAALDLENIAQGDASVDVVLCREGLMFAVDPCRGAREMHRVLRPNGRAVVAVWASPQENPWLDLLLNAVREVTGIVVPPPGMPGPFALSDGQDLQRLFADAGFSDITLLPVAVPLLAASFEAWWSRVLSLTGPVVGVLNGLDESTREQLKDSLRLALARYETDGALHVPGLALVLRGRRS
jgi:ubiquinone/menaquinone biosynthesis C-methylase UbiE